MKQETNDTVIKVLTQWEQFQVNLNWDVDATSMVRHFANIMRSMTYTTNSTIDALRTIADELECDGDNVKISVDNELNDENDGTTD